MRVFRHNLGTRLLLYSATIGLYVFVFMPVAVVVYGSFDPNEVLSFPYHGASLRWYREFFESPSLLTSIRNSIGLGVAGSLGATLLGTIAAVLLSRFRFSGQGWLETTIISPMVISKVMLGAAILTFMASLELPRSWLALVLLHVLITLPFAVFVVRARLQMLQASYEEASLVLGADDIATFGEVTLPLIAPAILGAVLLCFTVSFDEFSATQFLVTPRTTTVPIQVYSMIQTAITPTINVLATFLILITCILPAVAQLGLSPWRGRQGNGSKL
jgi:spermidine/putrescine transport system permease protein